MRGASRSTAFVPVITYVIIIATKAWMEAWHPGIWPMIATTLLIAIADSIADSTPEHAAYLSAARLPIGVVVFLATFVISIAMFLAVGTVPIISLLQPLFIGIGVGTVVQLRFSMSFIYVRQARSTRFLRLSLATAVGVVVLFLPVGPGAASASYVLGCGCGFFFPVGISRWKESRKSRELGNQLIVNPLRNERTESATPPEVIGAILLACRNLSELKALLQCSDRSHSPGLAIIDSTYKRILGDDVEAVKTLRDELRREIESLKHRALMNLLLAVFLRQRGSDDEMSEALSEAKRLVKNCPLVNLLCAEELAESLPLPGETEWSSAKSERARAKKLIDRAVELGASSPSVSPESTVVAYSVPLTRTFRDMVYAYVLLKLGNLSASEKLLEGCLHEDSSFALVYLRYGELRLAHAFISRARKLPEREELSNRAAQFCFSMAIRLETREGHVTRRAKMLLKCSRQHHENWPQP